MTKDDEGWYHCEAFNQKESIKSHPAFLLSAGNTSYCIYQHCKIICPFHLNPSKGRGGGSFLKIWAMIRVIVLIPLLKNTPKCLNHTTVVAFVQLANKTCVMVPEMDWSFVQHPANMTVKRGENVTVVCRPPYSRPTAQVSWFKNNQLYIPTNHVVVLPSGDLFFQRCVSLKATCNFS